MSPMKFLRALPRDGNAIKNFADTTKTPRERLHAFLNANRSKGPLKTSFLLLYDAMSVGGATFYGEVSDQIAIFRAFALIALCGYLNY